MRKKWRKKKEITDSELKQLNLEEIEEEMEKLQPEAYPEITFNHSESTKYKKIILNIKERFLKLVKESLIKEYKTREVLLESPSLKPRMGFREVFLAPPSLKPRMGFIEENDYTISSSSINIYAIFGKHTIYDEFDNSMDFEDLCQKEMSELTEFLNIKLSEKRYENIRKTLLDYLCKYIFTHEIERPFEDMRVFFDFSIHLEPDKPTFWFFESRATREERERVHKAHIDYLLNKQKAEYNKWLDDYMTINTLSNIPKFPLVKWWRGIEDVSLNTDFSEKNICFTMSINNSARGRFNYLKRVKTEINKKNKLNKTKALAAAHTDSSRELAESVKRKLEDQINQIKYCPYCFNNLDKKPHADHIYPVSMGGLSTPENMVYVCSSCNLKKMTFTLREFIEKYNLDKVRIEKTLKSLNKKF
jgi:5-methylcytosine-specific restriction endonuclease McrA